MKRGLCIALHDVAPATWRECERILALFEDLGSPPVTLLVVPDYHGQGRIADAPAVCRSIDAWVAHGAEVALHGYFHRDDAAPARTPGAWIRRHVLTAGEGEFAALSKEDAANRIWLGRDMLVRLGWDICGFVPPAWLAGTATRAALCNTGLRYTCTHTALVSLPDLQRIAAPCLTASVRSAWRRVASRAWLSGLRAATSQSPMLRVALHPADARHAGIMEHWRSLLTGLLAEREPLTKRAALEEYRCAAPAPC